MIVTDFEILTSDQAESANDRRGEEILLSLIYPITKDNMSTIQREEFARAAEEQLEYIISPDREVKSESIGDVSVTYSVGESEGGRLKNCGQEISPLAYSRLMRCGLLTRWV